MGFFSNLFSKGNKGDKGDKVNPNWLYAPLAGKAVAITDVPDPTFAEGMLGNGIAIIPSDGKVYAPCNATVDMMFSTGHAVSLVSEAGAEILIHVGLETVSLEGKPFTLHVNSGDTVKKGDLLFEADLEMIKEAGLPIITPVIVCNSDSYTQFDTTVGTDVAVGDAIIKLGK